MEARWRGRWIRELERGAGADRRAGRTLAGGEHRKIDEGLGGVVGRLGRVGGIGGGGTREGSGAGGDRATRRGETPASATRAGRKRLGGGGRGRSG